MARQITTVTRPRQKNTAPRGKSGGDRAKGTTSPRSNTAARRSSPAARRKKGTNRRSPLLEGLVIAALAVLTAGILARPSHTTVATAADMAVTATPATMVSQVTGPAAPNDTAAKYQMSGGDLGVMWDGGNGSVNIAFGDSFGANWGDWRCDLLAKSTTPAAKLSAGLVISTMVMDRANHAKSLLPCAEASGSAHTLIPTGGVHVGGADYLSFMAVTSWGTKDGTWTTAYAGVARSTDGGQSWSAPAASRWANTPGVGEKFQMTALADVGGYVYRYGTPNGRLGSAYLSRVADGGDIMSPGAYSYWNGREWTPKEADAAPIVGGPVGELSVLYNASIGKWLMTYLDTGAQAIVLRSASSPTGPWSAEHVLASGRAPGLTGLYGGFMHPWSTGSDLYFTVSLWDSYEVYLMHSSLMFTPTASAALLVSDHQQDYFGRGSDGHLHHWFWTLEKGIQNQDWGGDLAGTPTAFLNGTEQEVFGRGSDGHLHHWAWNPSLGRGDYIVQDWGGALAGAPTAFLDGREEVVFGRGVDGHAHRWAWNPKTGWDGWTDQNWGGDLAEDPSAFLNGSEEEVFGPGADGHLHHWFQTAGKATQVQDWGGDLAGAPTSFLTGSQEDVFGRGSDGHLHHWFWNPGPGSGTPVLEDWGGDLVGSPAGYFIAAENQSNVYARGSDGRLHLWFRNPGTAGGAPQTVDWGGNPTS